MDELLDVSFAAVTAVVAVLPVRTAHKGTRPARADKSA
jgi:hypothetical protein